MNGKEHQVKGKEKGCLASYGKVTPKASFSRVFVRPYLSYHFWRLIAGEQRREERPDDTKGKELKRRDKRYKQNSYSFFPIPLPSLLSWLSFHRFSLMTATLFRLVSLCERRERSEWRDEGMECKDEAREARGNGVGDGRRKAT